MRKQLADLLSARDGHFLLESGHHGELWLDLELLCLHPERVQPLAAELARRLARLQPSAICGPLIEGAFIGLMVAAALRVEFFYTERITGTTSGGLYSVDSRVPKPLRTGLQGQRVIVVNDVINAGSSVRGTVSDLAECGADVIGIASLLVLGDWAARFARDEGTGLEALDSRPNRLWTPADCPLCASGVPLVDNALAADP